MEDVNKAYRPFACLLLSVILTSFCACQPYTPTWESLDSRPLPPWYDEAKIGIFLHWGVFSVPSFSSEWFWDRWLVKKNKDVVDFMKNNYPPDFTYADFAPMFTTEFFNPLQWAEIFQFSGARYVVLTSKHHEGFTNWPSKVSFNWNAMDVGPNKDLVGLLAQAIRNQTNLHFGLYHSLAEWFNPLQLMDKENGFRTREFPKWKTMPELYELASIYKPDIIWSDGVFYGNDDYWGSRDFLTWLYNDSPNKDNVVVNDRWGNNTKCKHGGYFTCHDKYNPKTLQKYKFENSMTLDKHSWGYRREATVEDILTIEELLLTIAQTVSCNGNILINVGPTKYGTIAPIYEERLRQMGNWLDINYEGILSTRPWIYQNDTVNPDVWYTCKKQESGVAVYAILFQWPKGDKLHLAAPSPTASTKVTLLGYSEQIYWERSGTGGIDLTLRIPFNKLPCKWAWVFKIENLANGMQNHYFPLQ